jgi:uroporphyrinogen III methyltransferase/synthase
LARADCVIYDRLVNPALLGLCRPDADLIYVGKCPGRHEMTQEAINALLVERCRLGRLVVRLKGGDPLVFGRGGEECDALAAAGIEFRIVPGVTAAMAAGAFAGIPLTDRRCGPTLAFVTGHEQQPAVEPRPPGGGPTPSQQSDVARIDWSGLARMDTVVFYMGVGSLPTIAQRLMAAGRSGQTPAAVVERAGTPRQRTVVATLATIAEQARAAGIASPAIAIVGQVVAMRPALAWYERLGLFGRTIVVTRSPRQASALARRLSELGALVIEAPAIDIRPAEDPAAIDGALRRVKDRAFDWLVLTSPNGVEAILARMEALSMDARALSALRIAAVGPGTADALRRRFVQPDLIPGQFTTDALAAAMIERIVREHPPDMQARVLLARANIAPAGLCEALRAGGASVEEVVAYRTVRPASLSDEAVEALRRKRVDWITFTSSSTVENFLAMLASSVPSLDVAEVLSKVKLAAIGPVTAGAIDSHGLRPAVVAHPHTIEALVEAIVSFERSARQP